MPSDSEPAFRVALAMMMLGAAAIGLPHRLRADRAGGRVSPRVDPGWFWAGMALVGPPLVFVGVAFLFAPQWVEFSRIDLPNGVRCLGMPIGAAGLALFLWMFRHLGLNVTSTSQPRAQATLVTTGPYRWVRHPMYSAALTLIVAASLLTANALMAIGGLAMFALLAARSRTEERRLVEKFGDAYRAYQGRTGRFVPRLGAGARERRPVAR